MQHIAKTTQPKALIDFIAGQFIDGEYVNCNYSCLDTVTKRELKQILLEEQGYICCYTGHQIDFDGSHIEHVRPQSQCSDLETLDYTNMIAAYPHSPRGYLKESDCEYGAQARKDRAVHVTPLQANCTARFRFLPSGDVVPFDVDDEEAKDTIQVLVLSHSRLQELRKAVIDEAIFQRVEDLTSREEIVLYLEKLADAIVSRNTESRLHAFCFVIRSAALDLLLRVG